MTYNDKNNFININEIKNLYKPKAENLNLEKLKENLINKNKLCGIKNNNLYYDNIYNYLISFEINTTNNKTKWKNVLYPKDILDEKDNKITRLELSDCRPDNCCRYPSPIKAAWRQSYSSRSA